MINPIQPARIILFGCGPHARRIYLPALKHLKTVELCLTIDLESQASAVNEALQDNSCSTLWLIEPFSNELPVAFEQRLSTFAAENGVSGVIIATEPLVHKAYASWALRQGLSVLMDKPVTTRARAVSSMESADGILADYEQLMKEYHRLQQEKETIFIINSQRRFHKGFQLVKELIAEIAEKTNCPVSFIQAYHCDGQWRLPNEIISQQYHPYCSGYGKVSHSGYHILDTAYQFYIASGLTEKLADHMHISSAFIQPAGFFSQLTREDYNKLFGPSYNEVNPYSDETLKARCADFGELDLSAVISLKKHQQAIANISINLLHNGFAGRTWLSPGKDLYKGNGRIKHESYTIQQGPFQNIQIHAYQASDKHDERSSPERHIGGKNHFEIYVFRNPMFSEGKVQPQLYRLEDITEQNSDSFAVEMDQVKFKVVEEFANYLNGKIEKRAVRSQLSDHLVPVQMMSGIYRAHLQQSQNEQSVTDFPFSAVQSTERVASPLNEARLII